MPGKAKAGGATFRVELSDLYQRASTSIVQRKDERYVPYNSSSTFFQESLSPKDGGNSV